MTKPMIDPLPIYNTYAKRTAVRGPLQAPIPQVQFLVARRLAQAYGHLWAACPDIPPEGEWTLDRIERWSRAIIESDKDQTGYAKVMRPELAIDTHGFCLVHNAGTAGWQVLPSGIAVGSIYSSDAALRIDRLFHVLAVPLMREYQQATFDISLVIQERSGDIALLDIPLLEQEDTLPAYYAGHADALRTLVDALRTDDHDAAEILEILATVDQFALPEPHGTYNLEGGITKDVLDTCYFEAVAPDRKPMGFVVFHKSSKTFVETKDIAAKAVTQLIGSPDTPVFVAVIHAVLA